MGDESEWKKASTEEKVEHKVSKHFPHWIEKERMKAFQRSVSFEIETLVRYKECLFRGRLILSRVIPFGMEEQFGLLGVKIFASGLSTASLRRLLFRNRFEALNLFGSRTFSLRKLFLLIFHSPNYSIRFH